MTGVVIMSQKLLFRAQIIRGNKPRGIIHGDCGCNLEISGAGESATYDDAVVIASGRGKRPVSDCPDSSKMQPENLMTHTGKVHAPGSFSRTLGAIKPKCAVSASAIARLHFLVPIDAPVTCKNCIAALAKEGSKVQPAKTVEPAPVPENWLWMAKHANTETARAWWCKKCGIEG
jgi:hypothetical protein